MDGTGRHSIGEIARASGLSISALRFYDGAGVLVPAEVDAVTGYRRYSDGQLRAARLVAGLRRVGMPVADITRAVAELAHPPAVRKLLDEHLRRLEDGLADARRELSRVHALLDLQELALTTITLPAAALAAALDAVRFAASADPELPVLGGVLFETGTAALTLVATDRYRLAVAEAEAAVAGPPVRLVAPLPFVDELRPLLSGTGPAVLTMGPEGLSADVGGRRVEGGPLDVDFPDHHRLVDLGAAGSRQVRVDVSALRAAVDAVPAVSREHNGKQFDLAVLALDPAGALRVAAEADWAADEQAHVAVNREFLLQALDAGGAGQLVLQLDGPIKPLAVRGTGTYSILMPVRR
ncbi:MerR family transcriptional regulator [Actinoplanes sp. NPDC049599]|uniref:DNA polymerase III subunit beta family protein n=1 Tax=Actinoplanes sp. NPDC049599 TaxID=3363903 RepID=UPI0037A6F5A6